MSETAAIVGGCLCGAVRFAASGPALFCVHCHCHWCRRAHGAAFVTWLGVKDGSFELTRGADLIRDYQSSAESARRFCGVCGTTLFFVSKLAPGEVHIALACVDGPAPLAPTAHIFFEAHVPWLEVRDELPKYDRDSPGLRKYQVIAREP